MRRPACCGSGRSLGEIWDTEIRVVGFNRFFFGGTHMLTKWCAESGDCALAFLRLQLDKSAVSFSDRFTDREADTAGVVFFARGEIGFKHPAESAFTQTVAGIDHLNEQVILVGRGVGTADANDLLGLDAIASHHEDTAVGHGDS